MLFHYKVLNLLQASKQRGRKACQTRVTTKDLRTMIDTPLHRFEQMA